MLAFDIIVIYCLLSCIDGILLNVQKFIGICNELEFKGGMCGLVLKDSKIDVIQIDERGLKCQLGSIVFFGSIIFSFFF